MNMIKCSSNSEKRKKLRINIHYNYKKCGKSYLALTDLIRFFVLFLWKRVYDRYYCEHPKKLSCRR